MYKVMSENGNCLLSTDDYEEAVTYYKYLRSIFILCNFVED